MLDYPDLFVSKETTVVWNLYHFFAGYGQISSRMPRVAKLTNFNILLGMAG